MTNLCSAALARLRWVYDNPHPLLLAAVCFGFKPNDGVKRDGKKRDFIGREVEKVCVEAAQDGLVSNNEQWLFLSLKLVDYGFETRNNVEVGFTTRVSIAQLVVIA